MLWAIAAILFVIWVLGLVFDILGGFVHILLVAAVIAVVFHFVKSAAGRRRS